MPVSFFALLGFTFTTICSSLCPVSMNMMAMSPGDMPMMSGAMAQSEKQKAPCSNCYQSTNEVAAITAQTVKLKIVSQMVFAIIPAAAERSIAENTQSNIVFRLNAKPPPLAHMLVGTVILRT